MNWFPMDVTILPLGYLLDSGVLLVLYQLMSLALLVYYREFIVRNIVKKKCPNNTVIVLYLCLSHRVTTLP